MASFNPAKMVNAGHCSSALERGPRRKPGLWLPVAIAALASVAAVSASAWMAGAI